MSRTWTFSGTATSPDGTAVAVTGTATVTDPTPPPPTLSVSLEPASVTRGQSATLTWATSGATSLTCNGTTVPPSGNTAVSPSASADYVFFARGEGGVVERTVTLSVTSPPPTVTARVSPPSINLGQSAVLSWETTDATAVTLNGAGAPLNNPGSTVTPAATTTYTLLARGEGGTAERRVTLTVIVPVPTASISVSPASVVRGQSATLTWATTNAADVKIRGVSVGPSGSMSVNPATTTLYDIVATGPGGTTTAFASLSVTDPIPDPTPVPDARDESAYIRYLVPPATIRSSRAGLWSVPSTWDLGRVPVAGDVVYVDSGEVIYDVVSNDTLDTVAVRSGVLTVRTYADSRLVTRNLIVLDAGEFRVGTGGDPVSADVKAEIVIADRPLDTARDPLQMGHGLLCLGAVTTCGAAKTGFARLATEPRAGQVVLSFAEPVTGWRAGDRLVLPDTRRITENLTTQWETATIGSVLAGDRGVTLTSPLAYNHLGARDPDGNLEFLPHVANLTRNVVIKSQNSSGTRGHTLYTDHAEVDIRNTQFAGLGRTTLDVLNDATIDSQGRVTRVGSNQRGRYSAHFHHLHTQPVFEGNVVACLMNDVRFRWGVAVHGTNNGLFAGNVLYNWAGAGLVTEDGSESENLIARNFVGYTRGVNARGDERWGQRDFAFEGSAFWFAGADNRVVDNVAAGGTRYGYNLFCRNRPGVPIREFSGNEAYGGMTSALTIWELGAGYDHVLHGIAQSVVRDFHAWHFHREALYAYPIYNVLFDRFVARGIPSDLRNGNEGTKGFFFSDYLSGNVVIRDADVQGLHTGFFAPSKVGDVRSTGTTPQQVVIEGGYFRCVTNVLAQTMFAVTGGGGNLSPRETVLRNVRFAKPLPSDPDYGQQSDISTSFRVAGQASPNALVSDVVRVYTYNGVAGDDFRVYYREQRADFVLPPSGEGLLGLPVGGLTNAEAWARHGVAVAGAVAPSTATTLPAVVGLVTPA